MPRPDRIAISSAARERPAASASEADAPAAVSSTVTELKIVATTATTTDPPMYRAMFEIPDACPTWSCDTAASRRRRRRPIRQAEPGREHHEREDEGRVRPGRLDERQRPEPDSAEAEAGDDREPRSDAGRERRDQRGDGDQAGSRGKRRHARLERAHPEGRRILEVETEDVHQAVDRARDDQDRQCRPDEHLVAEQVEIDDRGGHALLDDHEEHGADGGGDEASECGRRRPAPVAALAEPEHERSEHDGDQDRAGVVDRARPLRVARLLHLGERQRDARGRDRSVEPEQALPAAQLDERSADERAHGRPRRRGGAPERDRPHLSLARGGDRQEAHPAGQDRGAGSTLDQAPDDDPGAARRQRDQHARGDEEQRARRGTRACGRTRLRAPRRSRSPRRRRACSRSPPTAAARWERRCPRSSSAAGS